LAGGELAGRATGLEDVRLDLGGASVAIDLGKAERIESSPHQPSHWLSVVSYSFEKGQIAKTNARLCSAVQMWVFCSKTQWLQGNAHQADDRRPTGKWLRSM